MLSALLSFWTHMLAAVLFTALALWKLRGARDAAGSYWLAGAIGATALWAWIVALEGRPGGIAPLAETVRNVAWLGFLFILTSGGLAGHRGRGARVVFGCLAGIVGLQLALDVVPLLALPPRGVAAAIGSTATILRVSLAAGALVVVHNVYGQAAPEARDHIRLPMLGLAALFIYDLNLYTVATLSGAWPTELAAMRGAAAAAAVPLFALARRQQGDWRIKLSRAATFQSLSIGAICAYFLVMTIGTGASQATGWAWVRDVQILLLVLMTAAAAVLIPSGRARGWLRVTLTKHLFQHRYDYRAEWLRFTHAMSGAGADAAPVGARVLTAMADIVGAPAGLLLVPGDDGRLEAAARWNWHADDAAIGSGGADHVAFAAALAAQGRVLDFTALREKSAGPCDASIPVPAAIIDDPRIWAGVPLVHEGRLTGLVLLAAPPYRRTLDWEDFDLLRTAARGAASYLAEARGQEALSQSARFDEFNRRFAFILHDLKNLVSGLSLVARNAERHADNPAFRSDMIATLKSSVERMNDLLAKLSPHESMPAETLRDVTLAPFLKDLVTTKRRRHDIRLLCASGGVVVADPARLEQALIHLIDNAIDASALHDPVLVNVARQGDAFTIAIIDRGAGMSADFVRAQLFQPFASTKSGGFGIGAHQARSLVTAMGGRLSVNSREGEGTRFTISLPAVRARELAA